MICPVEMLNCDLGLYKIHWKAEAGGKVSYASVGNSRNGERWFAPANWTSGSTLLKDYVSSIARMELVLNERDRLC